MNICKSLAVAHHLCCPDEAGSIRWHIGLKTWPEARSLLPLKQLSAGAWRFHPDRLNSPAKPCMRAGWGRGQCGAASPLRLLLGWSLAVGRGRVVREEGNRQLWQEAGAQVVGPTLMETSSLLSQLWSFHGRLW